MKILTLESDRESKRKRQYPMALKGIFVIAAACLLARMEVVSSLNRLSSVWKITVCDEGNLMKINTDNCSTVAGTKQCEGKSTGRTTGDDRTQFKIEEPDKTNKPRLHCIQFTDIHDSSRRYALKAINGSSLAFEEGGCHGNIGSDFLFEQHETTTNYHKKYTYRPSQYTDKCLTGECDGGLSLASVNNVKDRKCFFRKLSV